MRRRITWKSQLPFGSITFTDLLVDGVPLFPEGGGLNCLSAQLPLRTPSAGGESRRKRARSQLPFGSITFTDRTAIRFNTCLPKQTLLKRQAISNHLRAYLQDRDMILYFPMRVNGEFWEKTLCPTQQDARTKQQLEGRRGCLSVSGSLQVA